MMARESPRPPVDPWRGLAGVQGNPLLRARLEGVEEEQFPRQGPERIEPELGSAEEQHIPKRLH